MLITSTHNPKIKALLQLAKPSARRETGLFLVEGVRETERALKAGYVLSEIYREPELFPEAQWLEWQRVYPVNSNVFQVSRSVFNRLAYREDMGGVLAVFQQGVHGLDRLRSFENGLFLVLESVEKPGNLGALLRTADAAGLDGVILCDIRTDLYNPNVIRSSLGCVFHVPVAIAGTEDVIHFLKARQVRIMTTSLQAALLYDQVDYRRSTAIVMGTEDQGVSRSWMDASDQPIIIPMRGIADSLNVSVSAAIVVYEACRQRGFR